MKKKIEENNRGLQKSFRGRMTSLFAKIPTREVSVAGDGDVRERELAALLHKLVALFLHLSTRRACDGARNAYT